MSDEMKNITVDNRKDRIMSTTAITETTTTTIVTCWSCKQPVQQSEALEIRVVEPTGRYRNGKEVLRVTGEVVHECDGCWDYFQKPDKVE
jgi:hypothetical protein